MSSEGDFRYSSVINEEPTIAAELQIVMVDPEGQRPPVVWHAVPTCGSLAQETGTRWSRWVRKFRHARRTRRNRRIRRLLMRND